MRSRQLVLIALAVTAVAGSAAGPSPSAPPAQASPMRLVASGGVGALVPPTWEFRPIASSASRVGLQASRSLDDWIALERRSGLEAYWVDATRVGVPSDYYYLAAEGPAMRRLPSGRVCRRESHRVLTNRRPLFDEPATSPGDYVATATGTCGVRRDVTRWASFVAAPGYGPVRRLGIPESGLYVATVVVPEGPRAPQRIDRLLSRVTFGGTRVADFLRTAGASDRVL